MAVTYKAELVGVFGYPVAENPTCVMQEAAFHELGLNWRYLTIEVKPEGLPDAMRGMRAMGFQGINLTIPHKVAVMEFLDEIAPDAAMIGAVNTVRRDGDRLIGENTDGKGFLRGVREEGRIDPKGKRVVVLGAGGAARAITVELALAGASELHVLNRSPERGEAMVNDLKARAGANARFERWSGTYQVTADVDILVNATSIGLFPDVEAMPDVSFDGAPRSAGVRCRAQSAGNTAHSGSAGAWPEGAHRSAHAGLSRRHWLRDVDRSQSAGASDEGCARQGVRRLASLGWHSRMLVQIHLFAAQRASNC